jgi:hypothetical protein
MGDVVLKVAVSPSNSYEEFILKMHEIGFASRYEIREVTSLAHAFRDDFLDYIAENGMSSLLSYTITMEDVTSPSMSVNDVELIISKFIERLRPIKRLLIIDPYFYGTSPTAHQLLERLLLPHQTDLVEITVICNNTGAPNATNMRLAINSGAPNATISEIQSSAFHDRFWINPDLGSGVVMGTSLNGIGRKVALVDRLQNTDVADLVAEAKAVGYVG